MRALLAALIAVLVGGGSNAAPGEQGADTPVLALVGGALALGVVIVAEARRPARETQDDWRRNHRVRSGADRRVVPAIND